MKIFVKFTFSKNTLDLFVKTLSELYGRPIPDFPFEDGHIIDINIDDFLKKQGIDLSPEFLAPYMEMVNNFKQYVNTDPAAWAQQKLNGFVIRTKDFVENKIKWYLKYNGTQGYYLSKDNIGAAVFSEVNAIELMADIQADVDYKLEIISVDEMLLRKK
jgi:hypothetical protein